MSLITTTLSLLGVASYAYGFSQTAGDACSTVGAACSCAICTSTATQSHGQLDIACDTPAFTCTSDDPSVAGNCIAATSGGSSKTRHRRMQQRIKTRAMNQCDGPTEALCALGHSVKGALGDVETWECVDVHSNLERCGGCVVDGNGRDCTQIVGALDIECQVGKCVVSSCMPGFTLQDGSCTEA